MSGILNVNFPWHSRQTLDMASPRTETIPVLAVEHFAHVGTNVLGSMLGNSLRARGRSASPSGTMIKTEKGTRRPRSCTVLRNCLFSLLVKSYPAAIG